MFEILEYHEYTCMFKVQQNMKSFLSVLSKPMKA